MAGALLRRRGLGADVDPYWANVVSFLDFEGANGSTTVTDLKGKAWTANGNAQISTAQARSGSSSGLLDGVGDYFETADHADFQFSASTPFTLEGFIRPVLGADRSFLSKRNSGTGGWALEARSTGAIWLRGNINGSYSDTRITTATGLIVAGTFTHWAFTSNGAGLFRLWVAGALAGSLSSAGALDGAAGVPVRIGRSQSASENDYSGNVDLYRFTKNVERYTGAFTPPTSFPRG